MNATQPDNSHCFLVMDAISLEALRESVVFHERDLGLTPAQLRDLSHRLKKDAAGRSDPQDWEHFRLGMETQNW